MTTSSTTSPPGRTSPSWRKPEDEVVLANNQQRPPHPLKRMRGLFRMRIAGGIALQRIKGKRGKMEINRLPGRAAQPGVLFPGRAAQPDVLFPGRAAQPGVLFPGRADKGREAAGGHAVGTSFASHSRLGLFDRLIFSIGRIGRMGLISHDLGGGWGHSFPAPSSLLFVVLVVVFVVILAVFVRGSRPNRPSRT